MADVRLTATNPEDSSVVPVACDAAGRLLLEERGEGPPGPPGEQGPPGQDGQDGDPFSGNFAGDVTFGGSAVFANSVRSDTFTNVEKVSVFLGSRGSENYAFVAYNNAAFRPNAAIYADGSATYAGNVSSGAIDGNSDTAAGARLYSSGQVLIQKNAGSTDEIFLVYAGRTTIPTVSISADGTAEFAGRVEGELFISRQGTGAAPSTFIGGSAFAFETRVDGSAGGIKAYIEQATGNAYFKGDVTSDGTIGFNLETDNDANYTTTTDAEGNESRVYNGPTLDVKDRLTKADAALQTLKTAAAAAADFAELKAAIATALADI